MPTIGMLRGTGLSIVLNPDRSFSLSDGRKMAVKTVAEARDRGVIEWNDEGTRRTVEAYLDQVVGARKEKRPASAEPAGNGWGRRSLATLFRVNRWALPVAILVATAVVAALAVGGWYLLAPGGSSTEAPAGFVAEGTSLPDDVRRVATEFSLNGLFVQARDPRVVPWSEMEGYRFASPDGPRDAAALLASFTAPAGSRYYAVAYAYDTPEGPRKGLAVVSVTPEGGLSRFEATPLAWASP